MRAASTGGAYLYKHTHPTRPYTRTPLLHEAGHQFRHLATQDERQFATPRKKLDGAVFGLARQSCDVTLADRESR